MSTKIIIKNKNAEVGNGDVPAPGDLEFGELAINYRTGKLFYKDHTNTIKVLNDPPPGGAGSGTDADLLDGIDSTEFLRSNVSDQYTNGTLTIDSSTALTFANRFVVSTIGTVGNISGSGPWVADITDMTTTAGFTIGSRIDAVPGTGSLYGGTPTSVVVTQILSGTSLRVTVTGGTTPTAGSITNIEKPHAAVSFKAMDGRTPFTVTSTTKVENLNADLLDGYDSTFFYSPINPPMIPATLQDVTDNGATTTNAIEILNTTQSNGNDGNITEGALIVRGGIGIEKDLHIKGDLHIVGTGTLRFGPYNVGATDGNLWWVRPTGIDLDPAVVNGAGEQLWTAFATLKYALKHANFGDTVLVQPGEYEEEFPLYVPEGVSIRGSGLRETQIRPTIGTKDKDAFLLSGDSTISDFTVKDFLYNSTNDTGYAFRFATYSATLTSGVATVTVSDTTGIVVGYPLTKISGTGAFGTNATVLSVNSATQFTVSVNHATSGTIVFSVVDTDARSTYVERCTVLTKGTSQSSSDPYGYTSGDAGRGALIDGALVSRNSLQAALLFNEVTFIVPNSRGIIMTNGARAEMLTSFVYFADLAIEGKVGTTGRGMDGKTYITISGKTGTWTNGSTLSYYDVDGSTLIASATIQTITNDKITIDGSASNFVVNSNRTPKVVQLFGNAQLDTAVTKIATASLLLDGTGDYLKIDATSDFQFDADFCAEGWFYPTTVSGTQTLFTFGTESTGRYTLFLDGTALKGNYYGASTTTFGGTLSTNTWYHIALTRSGSTVRVYLDGTALGTTETNSNTLGNSGELRIGADASNATFFAGNIDELRITKGFARYTGNFTPYTTARSSDKATVLLLHFNGADGSTAIVDDGINIQDIRCSAGGSATGITRYDRSEFGAELRTIACAFVYGNQGIKADGPDVLLQLMAHNFAYIGTGSDLTNDKSAVIQANEVIEVNGGKVYYNSVDQAGDFRVGDYFTVNFETGAVTFSGGTFDVSALGSLTFTDGTNTTTVTSGGITTGNLEFAGNSITTSTGNLTLDPSGSGVIYLNGDVNISGDLTASNFSPLGMNLTEYTGGPPGVGTAATSANTTDYIVVYTKSLTLTTDWADTGIKGSDLETGMYMIQLFANDTAAGGTSTNEYYSGTMSWYSGATASSAVSPSDEIVLHRAGASSEGNIFLRTLRTNGADKLKLQIYANVASSGASNYVFKFRRLM